MHTIRVFDPKGFHNPYKGSDWRSIEREPVGAVEATRPNPFQAEMQYQNIANMQEQLDAQEQNLQEQDVQELGRSGTLPMEEKSTLKKVKTGDDLAEEISTKQKFYGPAEVTGIAKDVIEKSVSVVKHSDLITKAIKLLQSKPFIFVLSERNTICGLMTAREVFRKISQNDFPQDALKNTKCEEVMISPVLCCMLETPLSTILDIILDEQIGFLPVVDTENHLTGVVTKKSILRYIRQSPLFFKND